MGIEPNNAEGRRPERAPPTTDETSQASQPEDARAPEPKKLSSLIPVASDQEPVARPRPPDLLPRTVMAVLGLTVISLALLFAIRKPSRVDAMAAAGQRDVEAVAGAQDDLDWLRERSPDLPGQLMTPRPAPRVDDVGVRMGATAAGAGFDMFSAMQAIDQAQATTARCWKLVSIDSVTVAIRFLPEGLAQGVDVEDRKRVGERGADCFENAFRPVTVPSFTGRDVTIRRTIQRE